MRSEKDSPHTEKSLTYISQGLIHEDNTQKYTTSLGRVNSGGKPSERITSLAEKDKLSRIIGLWYSISQH